MTKRDLGETTINIITSVKVLGDQIEAFTEDDVSISPEMTDKLRCIYLRYMKLTTELYDCLGDLVEECKDEYGHGIFPKDS